MKILIIKNTTDYVNVTNAMYNLQEIGLARAFNRQGHLCDVVYWGGNKEHIVKIPYDNQKFFQVFYLKGFPFLKNGIYKKKLLDLVNNYDIVHSGGYDQIESWLLSKKISNKIVIYNGTYYSDFNKKYNFKCKIFDFFLLPRYRKYHTFFDTKSKLSEKFLRDRKIENVTSIGVGIDLEQLQAKKLIQSELSKLLLKEKNNGTKIITYIGRIEERRNPYFLLNLFKKISNERSDIKLLIIGKGEENYQTSFVNRIRDLELEDRILYREYLKQELLPIIYTLSDAFILPTRYEIFGMVLLEAMYFKTPVITTKNGGSDMLIENNKTGIIIDNFNIDVWKDKIYKVLDDTSFSKNISDLASKKISNEYTWDKLVPKFIDFFQKKLKDCDK